MAPKPKIGLGRTLTPKLGTVAAEILVVKEKKEPINLDQETLERLWHACMEANKSNEKLCAAMQGRKLAFRDQNNFDIILSNIYQEEELMPFRTHILTYMREESGHDFLQWRALVEKQQSEKVVYQPREKYEAMLSQNPAMAQLKQLFPEIDY